MSTFSTDPGSRTAAEIEAEVDHEREHVAGTINALQSKLSMRALVDEAGSAFYEHGGEIGRTLGRQVRDNPLAAILAGVGLVWLMTGSGPRPGYRGDGWAEPDVYRTGQPAGLAPEPGRGDEAGDDVRGGFGERAAEWSGTIAEGASEAVRATQGALGDAREALADRGRNVRAAGMSARDWSSQRAHGMKDSLATGVDTNPLVFGGVAFALGAALGAALPRTDAEDELVGSQADRLKQKASAVVSSEAKKAKHVASAVMEEGKQIVEEAADTAARNMPDADTVAERTREAALDAADRLRTAGEIEAERRKLGDPGSSA